MAQRAARIAAFVTSLALATMAGRLLAACVGGRLAGVDGDEDASRADGDGASAWPADGEGADVQPVPVGDGSSCLECLDACGPACRPISGSLIDVDAGCIPVDAMQTPLTCAPRALTAPVISCAHEVATGRYYVLGDRQLSPCDPRFRFCTDDETALVMPLARRCRDAATD
jgi:hypothetical protein